MKQYLHTIMRSLCIMVMLCGMSTGAWAQVFREINTLEDWTDFASQHRTPNDDFYYWLKQNIILTVPPQYSVYFSYTKFAYDTNCTVTVNATYPLDSFFPIFNDVQLEENVARYNYSISSDTEWSRYISDLTNGSITSQSKINLIINDSFTATGLPKQHSSTTISFTENSKITIGSLDNPVSFTKDLLNVFSETDFDEHVAECHFSVATADELSYIVTNYATLIQKENVHFSLANDIDLSSVSEDLTSLPFENFSFGDHSITVGKTTPLAIPDNGSIAPVFTNETLQGGVQYYYSVTTDTWNEAVTFYNDLDDSAKENVYLVVDSDIELEALPDNTLNINADNLILNDDAKISVGKTTPIEFSSSDFTHVIDGETDNSVDYYFSVTSSNWDDAVSYYNNLDNKSHVYLVAESDIDLESLPSAPLDIAEDHFISSSSITVGSDSNPIEYSSDFKHVFNGDLDDNVTYYFSVTADTWSAFVDYYNDHTTPSNVYLVMTDDITLEGDTPATLTIDSKNFINNNDYKITVSATFDVFSSSDMNEAYVIYPILEYNVNQENWSQFLADIQSSDVTDETPVTISGAISITSTDGIPESPISLSNITFNNCEITVGSDSYDFSLLENFTPIFENEDNESNVTYYFGVGSDNWSYFTSLYSDLSKDNVYLKLTESVEADGTYIEEFNGHFDGNGKNVAITIPECTLSEFKPLFAEGMTNVTNVKYNCDNISITSAEELVKLHDEYSTKWYNICTNYSIDNEIDLSDQSWTRIDDTKASMTVTVNSTVTFPSCSVSNPLTIASEDCTDGYHVYSELTISSESDIESLAGDKSSLLGVCSKLKLLQNVDLTTYTSLSLPLTYSGEFDQNGKTITLAPLSVDDTEIVGLFDGVDDIEYDVSLLITSDTDLEKFAENQDNWTLCKKVVIGDGSSSAIDLTSFIPTIREENFDIDLTVSINFGSYSDPMGMTGYQPLFDGELNKSSNISYYLGIYSQSEIEALNGATGLDGSNYYITVYVPSEKAGAGYDYDLSSAEFSSSLSLTDVKDDSGSSPSTPIIILLSDKSSSEPFSSSEYIKYMYTPSYELVDVLFNNAITIEDNRGKYFTENSHSIAEIADFAGHGTSTSPYLIYSYEMLEKLIEIVNAADEDYTSGMYIKLASDINMQGNERLTDIDGSITFDSYNTATLQFTNTFKGHFDGDNHSIGGLTQPLFSSLDGATIEKLGIVDCYIENNYALTAAIAESVIDEETQEVINKTKISNCYVSGVSDGLIPSGNITATNCYAFNPQTYANRLDKNNKLATTEAEGYKKYNITEGTETGKVTLVNDLSGTHKVIKGNCYELATNVYSDCTLFIPADNTIYKCSPSDSKFMRETASSDTSTEDYINYTNWGDDKCWIENPLKSNVSLLHNVIYNDYWLNNSTEEWKTIGGRGSLEYLYSWYIVDKNDLTVPEANMRVNNIYYSRSTAPAGLNTIYLPFAWDPDNDLYVGDSKVSDAKVYILADKLDDEGNFENSQDSYTDYTQETELKFFQPTNANYALVSNALPTILDAPSAGWYIKRSGIANYYEFHSEIEDASEEASLDGTDSGNLLPNLYNNYWSDDVYDDSKTGRSFMDIDRLKTDDSGRAYHLGTFKTIGKGESYITFGTGTYTDASSNVYSCYKLNSAGTGFAKVTTTSTVQPFRTFFAINDGGAHANPSSGAKALSLGFCGIADINDNPTSIDGEPIQGIHLMTAEESRVYSLDGRYVGQYGQKKLARGMYIMNGKKFVVK